MSAVLYLVTLKHIQADYSQPKTVQFDYKITQICKLPDVCRVVMTWSQ